jgi:hypothetical protein
MGVHMLYIMYMPQHARSLSCEHVLLVSLRLIVAL